MFGKLLLKVLLEKAISFEENAYRYYESALERSAVSGQADLLRKLLAEELRHRMRLEEAQKTGDLGVLAGNGAEGVGCQDADEERPPEPADFGDPPVQWPAINPWSHRDEILEAALAAETAACRYYQTLSAKSPLKSARDLFDALRREEALHVEWLKRELEKGDS